MFQSANAQNKNNSNNSNNEKMSTQTRTQSVISDYDDKSSIWSKSTGTSTITMIKERMHRSKDNKTPAQKQAEKKSGQLSYVTLGTLAALKG
ncbi:hypothetical protein HII31_09502 [Pseudocercospora fuligena]|uniref:Uncharacterized protein n=1 Tax=Pseudocercospora fuligena TaxID=685502 RepID=A0A8H6VJJ3_9PEZI|nr:hypothetical protein HII31_09502 [Pseudocercospora fuligena]